MEDSIVIEHRQLHERYVELFNGLAAHLPGWTASITEGDNPAWYGPEYRYRLVDGEGHAISLRFIKAGAIHVSGHWPQNGDSWGSPSDVKQPSPSINCSLSRGYERIARDIRGRFLPDYLRIFALIQAKHAEVNAYRDRSTQAWKRLVDTKLVLNPRGGESGRDPSGDIRIGKPGAIDYDKGYGTVRLTGENSVQIELRSLPVETAIRVLRALQGGE